MNSSPLNKFLHLTTSTTPLLLLIVSWKRLLLSPLSTLSKLLLPSVYGSQTAFAILCLSTQKGTVGIYAHIKPLIIATLVTLAASVIIQLVVILFGAPILELLPETTLLSVNLALVAVFPLAYIIQLDNQKWQQVYALDQGPFFTQGISVVVGAWVGAAPIPLDWNREWQKWPVTILVGAYSGYFLGGLLAYMQPSKGKKS